MRKKFVAMIMAGVLISSLVAGTIIGDAYASEVDTMEAEVVEVTQEEEITAAESISVEAGEVIVVEKVVEETIAPETEEDANTEVLDDMSDKSIEALKQTEAENTTVSETEAAETEVTEEPEIEEEMEKIFSFVALYEDYSPIEGINIIVTNAETGAAKRFTTDAQGRVVAYLPCGEYLVYELANNINNGFIYNVEATFRLTVDGANAVNIINIHLLSETENPETESEETDVEDEETNKTNTDETETDADNTDTEDTNETEMDTTEQSTVNVGESNSDDSDFKNDEYVSNDTDTESDAMVTSSESAKTGDQQNILAVTIVLLASIIVGIVIIKAKKYNERNNW